MAKKIFVGNYKGGVGKTTSVYQLALHMVDHGKRVLMIDLDPQCSLSEICLRRIDKDLNDLQGNESLNFIYDAWIQMKKYPNVQVSFNKDHLIKKITDTIHFIPSNIFYKNGGLDELALELSNGFEDLLILQQFFQTTDIEKNYDYILFDCPPSNTLITQGAFLLCDYYIIPSSIQTMSIRGIGHYVKTVENLYKDYESKEEVLLRLFFGDKPKFIGIFETLKKGSVNNKKVLLQLEGDISGRDIKSLLPSGKYIFQTIINNYEDIARDTAEGKKRSEYQDLTDEILFCLEAPTLVV